MSNPVEIGALYCQSLVAVVSLEALLLRVQAQHGGVKLEARMLDTSRSMCIPRVHDAAS